MFQSSNIYSLPFSTSPISRSKTGFYKPLSLSNFKPVTETGYLPRFPTTFSSNVSFSPQGTLKYHRSKSPCLFRNCKSVTDTDFLSESTPPTSKETLSRKYGFQTPSSPNHQRAEPSCSPRKPFKDYRSASCDRDFRRVTSSGNLQSVPTNNIKGTQAESMISTSNNAYSSLLSPPRPRSISNNACCKAVSPARNFQFPPNNRFSETSDKPPPVSPCVKKRENTPCEDAQPSDLLAYCTVSPCGIVTPCCYIDASCSPCHPCCGRPTCEDPCCNFEEEYRAIMEDKYPQNKSCETSSRRSCRETQCCKCGGESRSNCEAKSTACISPKVSKVSFFNKSSSEVRNHQPHCKSCSKSEVDGPGRRCSTDPVSKCINKSKVENKECLKNHKSNLKVRSKSSSRLSIAHGNPRSSPSRKPKVRIKSCCISIPSDKKNSPKEKCLDTSPSSKPVSAQKFCDSMIPQKFCSASLLPHIERPCSDIYPNLSPTCRLKPYGDVSSKNPLKSCLRSNTVDLSNFYSNRRNDFDTISSFHNDLKLCDQNFATCNSAKPNLFPTYKSFPESKTTRKHDSKVNFDLKYN